jgi:AcrR family transcriptional regulator
MTTSPWLKVVTRILSTWALKLSQASKGDRTRKRLLDAAATEVARHGVAGTSINAIAAAAGLKTGNVYFHFESKDQLVEAMLEEGLSASLAFLDKALAAVPENADAATRLSAAIRAHATRPAPWPDARSCAPSCHCRCCLDLARSRSALG